MRTRLRSLARTLSRFCQSTVVLLRSFSVNLVGNLFQDVVAQFTHRAFVVGQGIVEGEFVGLSPVLAALGRLAEIFGHGDQFFDNLGAFDGAVAVAVQASPAGGR